jgi:uncharacterized protein YqgV (UPF0045/DUF77 family)
MQTYQAVEDRKVIVELSVVPMGGNGQVNGQIAKLLNIVDKTGLFYQRSQNVTCIEGEWNDISKVIYACYEQVQEESPQGFLKVSIR